MKKLLVVGLMVFAFAANSFASKSVIVEKMNEKETLNRVSRYLEANTDQKRDLQYVFSLAEREYKKALKSGLSEEDASEKALNFGLANSKAILDKAQYSKFLFVINMTINNEANKQNELLANN